MHIQVTFAPATAYTLDALGDIFTRSFENYFYRRVCELSRSISITRL